MKTQPMVTCAALSLEGHRIAVVKGELTHKIRAAAWRGWHAYSSPSMQVQLKRGWWVRHPCPIPCPLTLVPAQEASQPTSSSVILSHFRTSFKSRIYLYVGTPILCTKWYLCGEAVRQGRK